MTATRSASFGASKAAPVRRQLLVRTVARRRWRVADVKMFHYGGLTKEKYVAMGEYLARLHAAM